MSEKILLVDDEILLLDSLRRELYGQYDLDTAESGSQALEKIAAQGPYAVIITDFRMPKMDGIKLLTRVMEISPNTVRMMLTGNADLPTAIDAINKGQIFRFLSKPCSGPMLIQYLEAGLRQYQLVMAEKELLEKTLKESISMLVEVLSIVNPKAYGRSIRIQQQVAHIVRELHLGNGWQYETAASLSQLGWIIFSQKMLEKIETNQPFSAQEAIIFSKHPFVTSKLLRSIPRLELITKMILGQDRSIDDLCLDPDYPEAYAVDLGSHILKICIDYDKLLLEGLSHDKVISRLQAMGKYYHPPVLAALSSLHSYSPQEKQRQVAAIPLKELEDGMHLVEPIKNLSGEILVKEDTYINRSILIKLLSLQPLTNGIVEPIKVMRPIRQPA